MLLILPLSLALATPPAAAKTEVPVADQQSFKTALAEAFGHRSYVLLVLGFFTCGFQLAFITVHLPAYLVRSGHARVRPAAGSSRRSACSISSARSASAGCRTCFQSATSCRRSISCGRSRSLRSSRSRSRTFSAIAFGAISGLTWLSTVPPTSALIALMFGTRWFATLYGFAFVSHQVGGFLGVWLGGIVFEKFGSYTPIWWLSVSVRRAVGPDQSADRRGAGAPRGCAAGLMADIRSQLISRVLGQIRPRNKRREMLRWPHSKQSGSTKRRRARLPRSSVRRSRTDGRRRHRSRRMVDAELQGWSCRHRQGAGGPALSDDRGHRFCRHGRAILASALESGRQSDLQRLGSRRDPSRRLCRESARQRRLAGASA